VGAPIRLAALAAELGRALEGDGEVEIRGVADLASAGPADLAFVRSPRHAPALARSRAGAVIVPEGVERDGRPAIRSPNPRLDFARAVRLLLPQEPVEPGVHPAAWVDPGAEVHPQAAVGPGCAIGARARVGPRSVLYANVTLYPDVTIGVDCRVHAGCVLREGTALGDRVVLQPGVVLGGDGFGYELDEEGRLVGVPQVGRVMVEDDVEIGANTTVDRASLGGTRLGRGAKLDNLVQVGHNCDVGPGVLIVAQAGLGGSTRVERGAILMARAGVVDHVSVGEGAYVGPGSGVTADVAPGARVLGAPAVELAAARRIFAAWRRLPGLLARLRAVERRLSLRAARPGDEA
jgi:UDP-3-O-[3-hydroxymyristoyl] glucosamine N-acyltransferase